MDWASGITVLPVMDTLSPDEAWWIPEGVVTVILVSLGSWEHSIL